MSDKYINISKINWWDDLFMKGKNDSGVWVRYRDVEKLIREAPAADVVEVVRCKDCDTYNRSGCPDGYGVCTAPEVYGSVLPEDFFCKYGRRADHGHH